MINLLSRRNLLIIGTLLLSASPLLSALSYVGASLDSAIRGWKNILIKANLILFCSITIITLALFFLKNPQETIHPGTVAFSDYAPFFIYFYLLSLKPFTLLEIKGFCYAVLLTLPPQLLIAISEEFWHWHGQFVIPHNNFPVFDIFVGPVQRNLKTSAGFFNPNILSCYCIIVLGVSLSLLSIKLSGQKHRVMSNNTHTEGRNTKRLVNSLVGSCAVLALALLLSTGSKNGFIAFVIMLVLFITYLSQISIKTKMITLSLLASFTLLTIITFSWLQKSIIVSFLDRILFYQCGLQLIRSRPLLGWGIGDFANQCTTRMGFPMLHAHNIFIQLGVDVGLLLTTLILLLVVYLYVSSYSYFKLKDNRNLETTQGEMNVINIGLLVTCISVAAMHMLDLPLLMSYRLSFLYWICLAIPHSLIYQPNKSV
jgi:O-antigen ligase